MIEIVEVKSKKQKNLFVDFPTKLYKNNEYYVHPLRMDEMAIFDPKKNVSFDECEMVFYLAFKDGKVAGRICGIEQKVYNQIHHTKRIRFSRFDVIDDLAVAKALFDAVETWAKSRGLDSVHGPLGFNDLEREGLLIEGFDRLATFEENYNYPYYAELMEKCGYTKDIDYLSSRIQLPSTPDERIARLSQVVLDRYHLKIATAKNKKEYMAKYKDGIFDVLNEAYGDLYGVTPYNEKMKKSIISQFNLFIKMDYIITLLDEKDRVVAFGFGLPELAHAMRKCKGRLLPFGLFTVLKAKNGGKVADFGLIGIRKEYQNKGLPAVILNHIIVGAIRLGITTVETNHSLETNHRILQTWKNFQNVEQHKRYRVYIKDLNDKAIDEEFKPTKKSQTKSNSSATKSRTANNSKKSSTQKTNSAPKKKTNKTI